MLLLSGVAVGPTEMASPQETPVLLELFTSEGCSSCPPADRLLETLDRTQPVPGTELIVMSEHVDYWNRLGWTDPYSSPEFSKRQQQYAARFGLDSVYTPQIVIDGRFQAIGSEGLAVHANIREARKQPKLPLSITGVSREGGQVSAKLASEVPLRKRVVLQVALAQERAETAVPRGENSGRRLSHVAVVRSLRSVATLRPGDRPPKEISIPVPQGVRAEPLRLIVFLQDAESGQVVGVVASKL